MNNCKDPTCVYSISKKKCIKPNPYNQFISFCIKNNNTINECKNKYKKNSDEIKKNACKYYEDNLKNKKDTKGLCPKERKPINNICPEKYKILKKNKYDIDCCYKEKKIKKNNLTSSTETSNKTSNVSSKSSKSSTNKIIKEFKGLKEIENKNINKKTGKLYKKIYKYQNKPGAKKISK